MRCMRPRCRRGGYSASGWLLRAVKALDNLNTANQGQRVGAEIVRRAIEARIFFRATCNRPMQRRVSLFSGLQRLPPSLVVI